MNGHTPTRWTGMPLGPLPHESTLSVIWRFGWQNGLTGRIFFETCCGKRGFQKQPASLKVGLSDSFTSAVDWSLPGNSELECLRISAETFGTWLHKNFRFCPICLESGYHSIWYQFSLLNICPIHQSLLTEKCQQCGHATGYYGNTPQLARPYKCLNCCGMLSGASHSLSAHLDFREHSNNLEHAFVDLLRWAEKSKYRLLPLQNIPQARAWVASGKVLRWCNPEALARGLGSKLLPFPDASISLEGASISILQWRVSMLNKNLLPEYNRLSWRSRVQAPTAVYKAVVRRLRMWIFGTSLAEEKELKLRSKWDNAMASDVIDVMAWRPHELAYVLMRNSQSSIIDLGMDLSELAIKEVPSYGISTFEDRAPRTAFRALYLAIFAGYFHWVTRARRSGKNLRFREVVSVPVTDLIAVFNVSCAPASLLAGGVFFPSIQDMPIANS